MFAFLGWMELVVLLAVALVVFAKWVPPLARSLGKALVDLKKGAGGLRDEVKHAVR